MGAEPPGPSCKRLPGAHSASGPHQKILESLLRRLGRQDGKQFKPVNRWVSMVRGRSCGLVGSLPQYRRCWRRACENAKSPSTKPLPPGPGARLPQKRSGGRRPIGANQVRVFRRPLNERRRIRSVERQFRRRVPQAVQLWQQLLLRAPSSSASSSFFVVDIGPKPNLESPEFNDGQFAGEVGSRSK